MVAHGEDNRKESGSPNRVVRHCKSGNEKTPLRSVVFFLSLRKSQRDLTIPENRAGGEEEPQQFENENCKSSSSPRSISIGQLNALLRVHLRPIKLVVYERPYQLVLWDI